MNSPLVPQKREIYTLQVGAKGRVVIPASLRKQLDLREGDNLVMRLESDGSLRLVSLRTQLKQMRGMLKSTSPACSLVTELMQERQEEAQRE
ncbi:AbrB/MazE/SpoVT family DNA-binding domain-containing protein [Pantanalinema rosaneae CENA516]|uniref:AbrB/MazE/SpoVT family DNA-binding domain-containing protein n=1 Tax=Pantanalinema rosaneae TaxID=1620701 RepID=UPI003D6DAA76